MDYRKFLGQQQQVILPYFEGDRVFAKDRSFRLMANAPRLQPGWWTFSIQGRMATPLQQAIAPPLEQLPKVMGHLYGSRLVDTQGQAQPIYFLPEEEPPLFSPCQGRKWYSGELLFDLLLFESEAEEQVRQALEQRKNSSSIKGMPGSLRAAFAYHLAEVSSNRLQIPVSPIEVRPYLATISEGGEPAADRALRLLQEEREIYARAQREAQARRQQALPSVINRQPLQTNEQPVASKEPQQQREQIENRIESALRVAGAGLLRIRFLGHDQVEVTYGFMHERFISIVQESSLQIIDAGICLDDADSLVTLESLPGVIREAINSGSLVITRH